MAHFMVLVFVDARTVSDLPQKLLPFAVVTPEGAWHGQDDHLLWKAKFRELAAAHRDALAVAIDCHC